MLQSEKFGGRPYACSSNDVFHGFLDSFGMIDLGFSGNPFTWSNECWDDHLIKERLDRGITNPQWVHLFPIFLFGISQLNLLITIPSFLILLFLICLFHTLLDLKSFGLIIHRVVQLSLMLGIILSLVLPLSIYPKISKTPNWL